jgi:hypothetical protein
MVRELRKVKTSGELYHRQPYVEELLNDWDALSKEEIVRKCQEEGSSIPSESLVYLMRCKDLGFNPLQFKALFDILVARVMQILMSKVSDQVYDRAEGIREEILDQFIELIAIDRNESDTKLDYYEVRFNHALESLRVSYLRKVSAIDVRSVPLTVENEGIVDISPEVEEKVKGMIDLQYSEWSDPSFRSIVLRAIDDLPSDQKLVIGLLLRGMPIESADKSVVTISRALSCTDRTVRNRRNRAFETLREKLKKEELL